ncbi:hypothetical protein [Streptomyces sp. NPDC003032]
MRERKHARRVPVRRRPGRAAGRPRRLLAAAFGLASVVTALLANLINNLPAVLARSRGPG